MSRVVLDASAILAMTQGEPGGEKVEAALDEAVISTVNYSEAIGRYAREGMPPDRVTARFESFNLTVIPFDRVQAVEAGILQVATERLGLSLGDRACLALGRTLSLPVLTCDRRWHGVDVGVEIVFIR